MAWQMPEAVRPLGLVKRLVVTLSERFETARGVLDAAPLGLLKRTIRENDELLEPLVAAIFVALKREDPEIRLGAVHLTDVFFTRSHGFREKLVADFQVWLRRDKLPAYLKWARLVEDFLLYTAETDPLRNPLPPPQRLADSLKAETIRFVRAWHDKFGPAYRKLQLAHDFLAKAKAVHFQRQVRKSFGLV